MKSTSPQDTPNRLQQSNALVPDLYSQVFYPDASSADLNSLLNSFGNNSQEPKSLSQILQEAIELIEESRLDFEDEPSRTSDADRPTN